MAASRAGRRSLPRGPAPAPPQRGAAAESSRGRCGAVRAGGALGSWSALCAGSRQPGAEPGRACRPSAVFAWAAWQGERAGADASGGLLAVLGGTSCGCWGASGAGAFSCSLGALVLCASFAQLRVAKRTLGEGLLAY